MKLTLECYDEKYTIETKSDSVTAQEYIEHFTNLLICAGFARETIIECFNEM